ncbi:MAG: alpha/beta fold hydrolase [Myxococcota bacterium]
MRDGSGDALVADHVAVPPGAPQRSEAPLVVLVHGLGGTSESAYIQTTTAHLHALGHAVLQLNLRGAGASRPHCAAQYHAGRSRDLHDALAGLPDPLASNGLVVVGYSLGGNMILKFAAEFGGIRGAVSISAPIDLEAASFRFLDPRNRLYHAHLLRGMKEEMASTPGGLDPDEREALARVQTILDFDERIVAPRNGFASAKDYYDRNHARQFLGEIRVPTLLMHALDDPWIPGTSYTDFDWSKTPDLEALLPRGGGHVGFHARGDRVPWHDRWLGVFLDRLASGAR